MKRRRSVQTKNHGHRDRSGYFSCTEHTHYEAKSVKKLVRLNSTHRSCVVFLLAESDVTFDPLVLKILLMIRVCLIAFSFDVKSKNVYLPVAKFLKPFLNFEELENLFP